MSYTLRYTANDDHLTNIDDSDTVFEGQPVERAIIEACRHYGFSGAHVFAGSNGPLYGETGYEDNYHGWVDARRVKDAPESWRGSHDGYDPHGLS